VKLPVAILAGGLATRLHPLTETIPKALVEVAGKPFILRQLDYLRRQGVSRAVLCVGFLGEQIEAVVGDGSSSGLTVSYSQDWPKLMGTGGALRQALPLLDSQFLVLYGDSYLPIDFSSVEQTFLSSGKPALMTVQRNADQWDKSNVLFRNGELIEYDKKSPRPDMLHIDFGLSVLSSQVFSKYLESTIIDLADICRELSKAGQLAAVEVSGRFYEIGSPQGIRDTEEFLAHQEFLSRRSINE